MLQLCHSHLFGGRAAQRQASRHTIQRNVHATTRGLRRVWYDTLSTSISATNSNAQCPKARAATPQPGTQSNTAPETTTQHASDVYLQQVWYGALRCIVAPTPLWQTHAPSGWSTPPLGSEGWCWRSVATVVYGTSCRTTAVRGHEAARSFAHTSTTGLIDEIVYVDGSTTDEDTEAPARTDEGL